MLVDEGNTLTTSIIASTSEKLHNEDYSSLVSYCNSILQNTPNLLYMIFSKRSGEEIYITKKQWSLNYQTLPIYKNKQYTNGGASYTNEPVVSSIVAPHLEKDSVFEYNKGIMIFVRDWGVLTLGMSKEAYVKAVRSFIVSFVALISLTTILCLFIRT